MQRTEDTAKGTGDEALRRPVDSRGRLARSPWLQLETIATCVPGVCTDPGNAHFFWARPVRGGYGPSSSPPFSRRSIQEIHSIVRLREVLGMGPSRTDRELPGQLPADRIGIEYAFGIRLRGNWCAARQPYSGPVQMRGRSRQR